MPFPVNPPKHMPCPHWNHFPISPAVQMFGAVSGSQPPAPDSYNYCSICNARQSKKD